VDTGTIGEGGGRNQSTHITEVGERERKALKLDHLRASKCEPLSLELVQSSHWHDLDLHHHRHPHPLLSARWVDSNPPPMLAEPHHHHHHHRLVISHTHR